MSMVYMALYKTILSLNTDLEGITQHLGVEGLGKSALTINQDGNGYVGDKVHRKYHPERSRNSHGTRREA